MYRDLFAVLRREPQLLARIDELAGAKSSVIQELADLSFAGNTLALLGMAMGQGATDQPRGILVLVDRKTDQYRRFDLGAYQPLALAAGQARIAVLARDGQGAVVVLLEDLLSPGGPRLRTVKGVPETTRLSRRLLPEPEVAPSNTMRKAA